MSQNEESEALANFPGLILKKLGYVQKINNLVDPSQGFLV